MSPGPLHGYPLPRLEQVSRGALQLNLSTLDPALMRLRRRLLRGQWGTAASCSVALTCPGTVIDVCSADLA